MTSSGTTTFDPSVLDYVIDSYERLNISTQELETRHMYSARRSANFVLSSFTNRGINLWRVDQTPTTIPIIQGISTYTLTSDVVGMLDTYLRQYQMGTPGNYTPAFSTVAGSNVVSVNQASNGLAVGNYAQVVVPVSVGGLVLNGYYIVTSVSGTNNYTFNAAGNATGNVSGGGVVPQFTTTNLSANVTVTFPNHGYLSGQAFQVQVYTLIGGVALQGSYTIQSVTDANTFVIQATNAASSSISAFENNGQTQIAAQATNVAPSDILLQPLSRNDYAAIPDKIQQGRPTTYWFNRQIVPQIVVWPLADNNGPYQLQTYLLHQIQDATPQGAQTMNLPYRFDYAFVSALAADLAIKFAPDRWQLLDAVSQKAWEEAADADREIVSTFISPDFSGYMV